MTDEDVKQPKVEKEVEPLMVRVVSQEGKAALVEWVVEENLHRVVLPLSVLKLDEGDTALVEPKALDKGVPYGLPWAKVVKEIPTFTPQMLEHALHKVGIWTEDDFNKNLQLVNNALRGLTSLGVTNVRDQIEQFKSK